MKRPSLKTGSKKRLAPKKRGPEPERVKIKGDWMDAVKRAFGVKPKK